MSIVLLGSTSGSITLQEPAIAGTTTLNLPATSGTLTYADGSGNFQMNSGYGSVATAYGCRAWVNFNGTGTVAIRASGNVSSITDNGTGLYTVNITNAMPDINYSISASAGSPGTRDGTAYTNVNPPTTSAFSLRTVGSNATDGFFDHVYVLAAIFR